MGSSASKTPERGRSEKEAPNPQRTTFLSGAEVIERSREAIQAAASAVEEARGDRSDERCRLFCDSLASLERDLSEALGRFREEAPKELLEEQSQYTVEIPDELLEERRHPADLDEATTWVLDLMRSLRTRFEELSSSAAAEVAQESYTKLAELMTAYEKRITRLGEGRHDL